MGTLVNTHGIRGELRMLPYNPDTAALQAGAVAILVREMTRTEATILTVRRHKRFLLLTLDGVTSAAAAEALVGSVVSVPAESLPLLSPGEVYQFELVGLRVETASGEEVGTVERVFSTAANDVCVVRNGPREVLIPLIADVVKAIDPANGRVVIEPMAGLIDDEC